MSYLGGDALGGSEYFTGGYSGGAEGGDCGCGGKVDGGGLFRETVTLPGLLISGNTLALFTSLTLFGILSILLCVFVFTSIDTKSTAFQWFAVLTVGVGFVGTLYLENKEGALTVDQQHNWRR